MPRLAQHVGCNACFEGLCLTELLQSEAASISTEIPAAPLDIANRETLAKRVADAFGQAFAKLAAHKSDIDDLVYCADIGMV